MPYLHLLPEGLGTLMGPRGSQVSRGQKQRLAIVKALLRYPKILSVNQLTSLYLFSRYCVCSSLTASLSVSWMKTLRRWIQNPKCLCKGRSTRASRSRTTIAAAHRLSSIAHAECTYVFESGAIVEYGDYDTLMKKRGKCWGFVQLQSLDLLRNSCND